MRDLARDPAVDRRSVVLTGDLRSTVFRLALPVLLQQFLTFCVGFYDTFLSGRIGSNATTAIGLAAYVGWLASMLFGLVGIGTAALVARFWGAADFVTANRITNRSIALAGLMGGLVYALIFSAAPLVASTLDMPPATSATVVRYLRLDGLGHLFTSVSLVGAAALRGAGDMRSPMFILGMVSVLNVLASTAFVFGVGPFPAAGFDWVLLPPLGIDGIVAGTLVARVSGGVLMLTLLARGLSGLRLSRRQLRVRGQTARRILRIGGPAALDGVIMLGGQFLFLMVIANLADGEFESAAFAAHIVGIQVEAITYLPAVAWGAAAATIIGQSLGAGDPQRGVRAGHLAVMQCSLLAVLITVVFYFGARPIYELMHEVPDVRRVGVPAFRLLALFQVPLVISIVYVASLRGAGDTRFPMYCTLIGVLGVRVPVAYLCGVVLQGGLVGAWIGMCADLALRALLVSLRYLSGRWVQTEV